MSEMNSFQLESEIFNAYRAKEGTYNNVASLQLNHCHVCSSGIIGENLLITSGQCAHYFKSHMPNKFQYAFAVLGYVDLNVREKYDIQNLLYHPKYFSQKPNFSHYNIDRNYDVGIVLVGQIIMI